MLQAEALTVEIGGRTVVRSASFTVSARDKVGIVGRNGAGKTTLFRVLGGELDASGGRVVRRGAFGYLPQDPRIAGVLDGRRAITHVLSGRNIDEQVERIERLRLAMESTPDDATVERYARAEEAFRVAGGYGAESEARALAAGLGISQARLELPLGTLSGGERRRVELARILFAGSDVLCLDEPTNHLDVDAKQWLMGFLRQYRGALLVISHDLDLLDEAITRVLHLDRPDDADTGEVVEYRGTYSQYQTARAEDERRLEKLATQQSRELARMQRVVDRFGAKATKASMAHNMERRIARLESERVDAPASRRRMEVRFPDPPSCGVTVVTVSSMCKGYGGPPVFEDVSFDLGRGERLLVLGLNGAGKTTLLRILAGELAADLGDVSFGHRVEAGYYAQEHDNLDGSASLLDNIRRSVPAGVAATETLLRSLLGMFGLTGDKVFQDAGTLSGGEKTKLALAMLMTGRNNLLLLDEPTNNLDPASRTAVADALSSWPGAMILVSHDTEFVERLEPTKVLLLPDADVDYFGSTWLELVSLA